MKRIPLTQGHVAFVDNEDFAKVNQYKWYYSLTPDGNAYAKHDTQINHKRTRIYLHRFIMDAKKGEYVDHKNGNTLDCQKENMRIATNQQNAFNITKKKKSLSGYKGVVLKKSIRKYYSVSIMHNGKTIHIGNFSNLLKAAHAYDTKARELFGEFAKTNFRERKTNF